MILTKILFIFLFLINVICHAQERTFQKDFKTTLNLFFRGSFEQFKETNNLFYAAAATPSLWYSFEHDDRIIENARTKRILKVMDLIGSSGVLFSFPVLPLSFYYYGRYKKSDHMIQFSMEYAAAMYITLVETGLLSHIDIHERPNTENLSFWEKSFRGKSSFASGHVVPFAALFFKTLQFYGPYYSSVPLVFTVVASMQRVREGRHYLSDVLGGFFLAAFASEGVRAAANYRHNHPFYKWVFERKANLGIVRYKNAIGPRLSFDF